MRSETAKKILSETSPETRDKVREYGELRIENDRLHSEIREFKLLVRRYFNAKDVAANPYNPFVAAEAVLQHGDFFLIFFHLKQRGQGNSLAGAASSSLGLCAHGVLS